MQPVTAGVDRHEFRQIIAGFEATFNANPAPAVITRLSDLRHVKVNAGFLEMVSGSFSRLCSAGGIYESSDALFGGGPREPGGTGPGQCRRPVHLHAAGALPPGTARSVCVRRTPGEICGGPLRTCQRWSHRPAMPSRPSP